MAGYQHAAYARSLAEFGEPLHLPRSDGWVLRRPIEGTGAFDAMGCYPLFSCGNWGGLCTDLDGLEPAPVSLVLVTDPFGTTGPEDLSRCFQIVSAFKEHLVVDLAGKPDSFVSEHHRRNIRKAAARVEVERCADPALHAAEWTALYAELVARHRIRGIARFSAGSLEAQLRVPGLEMFRAVQAGTTVGLTLWYQQGSVAYYHLAAYTEPGYAAGASFALFDRAIRFFADRAAWMNLGSAAGVEGAREDGLTRFKRGWATGSRTAYLAGKIFDPARYEAIVQARQVAPSSYFPLYRMGEFA